MGVGVVPLQNTQGQTENMLGRGSPQVERVERQRKASIITIYGHISLDSAPQLVGREHKAAKGYGYESHGETQES